jgi:hypothetical protein
LFCSSTFTILLLSAGFIFCLWLNISGLIVSTLYHMLSAL